MSTGPSPASPTPRPDEPTDRLSSWKEIAAYLQRDVTTAQRWEKREGMPVHRHVHDKLGSVCAFREELDAWLRRRLTQGEERRAAGTTMSDESQAEMDRSALSMATAPEEGEGSEFGGRIERRAGGRRPLSPRLVLLIGGSVAVAVIAVIGTVTSLRPVADSTRPAITSVAVLPMVDLSGDPTQAYFADGMTEALIGRLSGVVGLRVISRTSVMQFKDTRAPIPEIARALNVDALVEGTVLRAGDRVRITAQLVRAESGENLWAASYDRELGDVLTLQSEVTRMVASRIEATVTPAERARLATTRTVTPAVYEDYLKGLFLVNRGRYLEGIAHLERVTVRDPTFAPAHAHLAAAYQQLGATAVGVLPVAEAHVKAVAAARRALDLDPLLAKAHTTLAFAYQQEWRWTAAEAEYRQAINIDPSNADAQAGLAHLLLYTGRTAESLAYARRARQLDPLSVIRTRHLAWLLYHARQYDESIRELQMVLSAEPDDRATLWFLGFVLIESSRLDEAIHTLERLVVLWDRKPAALGLLARAYGVAGRRTDALGVIAELKRRERAGYVPPAPFVHAYIGLGNINAAFAALQRAYSERSNIMQSLKTHPLYDPLRHDARFGDLLRRVALE